MSLDKIAELYLSGDLLEDSQYSIYSTTKWITTSEKVFQQWSSSK